jgi:hypothetical protein
VNDRPTSVELLRAVEHFLQNDAVPALSGPQRYHARVAANVVAIVAREIETEGNHLRGEWNRLGDLMDLDEARPVDREALRADVVARTEALVQRIRAGDADTGRWRDDVITHLRHTVLDKLDVARPPRVD